MQIVELGQLPDLPPQDTVDLSKEVVGADRSRYSALDKLVDFLRYTRLLFSGKNFVNVCRHRIKWILPLRTHFVCVRDPNVLVCAPVLLKGTCAVIGGVQFDANAVDFIYGNASDDKRHEAVVKLIEYLALKGVKNLLFTYIREDSPTWRVLKKWDARVLSRYVNTIIKIDFLSHDAYFKSLGKHAKQNVRTAYNRMKRDGLSYSFRSFESSKDGLEVVEKEFERCSTLYLIRQNQRYGHRDGAMTRYFGRKNSVVHNALPSKRGMVVELLIDGELAAYAGVLMHQERRVAEIPELAINEAFGFYSPGLLLVNEMIKAEIMKGRFDVLNLGRGDEKYKMDMGGTNYWTASVDCCIGVSRERSV